MFWDVGGCKRIEGRVRKYTPDVINAIEEIEHAGREGGMTVKMVGLCFQVSTLNAVRMSSELNQPGMSLHLFSGR